MYNTTRQWLKINDVVPVLCEIFDFFVDQLFETRLFFIIHIHLRFVDFYEMYLLLPEQVCIIYNNGRRRRYDDRHNSNRRYESVETVCDDVTLESWRYVWYTEITINLCILPRKLGHSNRMLFWLVMQHATEQTATDTAEKVDVKSVDVENKVSSFFLESSNPTKNSPGYFVLCAMHLHRT